MKSPVKIFASFFAALLLSAACSPFVSAQTGSAVAYVYLTSNTGGGNFLIGGFSADSKGRLTPLSGSPFDDSVQYMALNGKYLFGTNDGANIFTYAIGASGGLTWVSSVDAQQYNDPATGGPDYLFLDHSGKTLYDVDVYGNNGANNDYQFFDINGSSGVLSYLGVTDATTQYWNPLSFTGNDEFAYSADCVHINPDIYGYQRSSNGSLTRLNITPQIPAAKSGSFYCPFQAAADPNSNVAISMQPLGASSWQPTGPPQLAVYTADGSGNLTTTSTYANMPKTAVQNVTDMRMSPSGELLAIGGTAGLQVFHFNGSNPITKFTGLLMKDPINLDDQMFWDNDNHLYVISNPAGKLYVYTITPAGARKAPGSPYTITSPVNIIVLPKK
jgi:hypothetical protein